MINSNELKGKMVAKGITLDDLSKLTNLSKATLSYKINNKRVFTVPEMYKLRQVLALTQDEAEHIFFGNEVEHISTDSKEN